MFPDPYRRPEPEEINLLPRKIYTGSIHIVRDAGYWKTALSDLKKETIFGFDTETKPSFAKGQTYPPALMQLATAGAVYLIQLNYFPLKRVWTELLMLPGKIKAGVGIEEDLLRLNKIYPIQAEGFVDLGKLATSCNLPNHGLRTLAASLFGWRISKNAQRSNWNVKNLSSAQIAYAATDAWISRQIYLKLMEPGFNSQGKTG